MHKYITISFHSKQRMLNDDSCHSERHCPQAKESKNQESFNVSNFDLVEKSSSNQNSIISASTRGRFLHYGQNPKRPKLLDPSISWLAKIRDDKQIRVSQFLLLLSNFIRLQHNFLLRLTAIFGLWIRLRIN